MEKVEIFEISGHDGKPEFSRLKIDQRIVQAFALGACGIASESEQQASENARSSPSITIRRPQTVRRNIKDRLPDSLKRAIRPSIGWIQTAKGMRQLRKANGRVVAGSVADEGVER